MITTILAYGFGAILSIMMYASMIMYDLRSRNNTSWFEVIFFSILTGYNIGVGIICIPHSWIIPAILIQWCFITIQYITLTKRYFK